MDPQQLAHLALERNLGWVRAADAKLPPVFAVDVAMLGALSLRLPQLDMLTPWVLMAWALAGVCLLASLVCLGLVAFPRLTGPKDSVVFFGTVAQLDESAYAARLLDSDSSPLLQDLTRQAYRNAEIAALKYGYLRSAMIALFAALPFWLISLVATRHM